jgi:ribosomal protein S18 acetylase RimI-like enzyme
MKSPITIHSLTPANYVELGCPCFMNPKHEGHLLKLDWLKQRFSEGLTVKLLFIDGEKKPIGFIEYVPGENAWRRVSAAGYLFIHCIWISPNKYKNNGNGSVLVNNCIEDARNKGKHGVAVIASTGAFMAGKELFIKNGFQETEQEADLELLTYRLDGGPLPGIIKKNVRPGEFQGLNIVYSRQCPWVARSVKELTEVAERYQLNMNITEMNSAGKAQQAPSVYATFSLIYNGKVLADRYISSTRFVNILKKDLKLIG